MIKIEVTTDDTELNDYLEKLKRFKEEVWEKAREIDDLLHTDTPIRTGRMYSTLRVYPTEEGFNIVSTYYMKYLVWWYDKRQEIDLIIEGLVNGIS